MNPRRADQARAGIAAWQRDHHDAPARTRDRAFDSSQRIAETHAAFIAVAESADVTDAQGPLAGVPFAVKDNIETSDLPTTAGSGVLIGSRPDVDAPTVRRLKNAGAWVPGKANLHELALGVTSANGTFGAVRNPVDAGRMAGGSSGGSAVAVALGAAPVALGTDTGGSMTIPAAFCGVVGYRPSTGRYPADGVVKISPTRDTVGLMAHTIADIRAVDRVMTGNGDQASGQTSSIRLGIPDVYAQDVDEDVSIAFRRAITKLRSSGVDVVDVDIAKVFEPARAHGITVVGYESIRGLADHLASLGEPCASRSVWDLAEGSRSPDVAKLLAGLLQNPVTNSAYADAIGARQRARTAARELLVAKRLDGLIYPTCPVVAPPLGAVDASLGTSTPEALFTLLTRNTEAGSLIGAPSLSVPIGAPDTLPVGLTVEGPPGGDASLFAIAELVESILAVPHR